MKKVSHKKELHFPKPFSATTDGSSIPVSFSKLRMQVTIKLEPFSFHIVSLAFGDSFCSSDEVGVVITKSSANKLVFEELKASAGILFSNLQGRTKLLLSGSVTQNKMFRPLFRVLSCFSFHQSHVFGVFFISLHH